MTLRQPYPTERSSFPRKLAFAEEMGGLHLHHSLMTTRLAIRDVESYCVEGLRFLQCVDVAVGSEDVSVMAAPFDRGGGCLHSMEAASWTVNLTEKQKHGMNPQAEGLEKQVHSTEQAASSSSPQQATRSERLDVRCENDADS